MELLSQLLAVAAVLSLAGVSAWLLRRGRLLGLGRGLRLGRIKGRGLVEVVENRVVSPQLTIYVIRISGTEFVIASHATNITVLKESEQ